MSELENKPNENELMQRIRDLEDALYNHQHYGYDLTPKLNGTSVSQIQLINGGVLGDGLENSGTIRMNVAPDKGDTYIVAGLDDGDFSNTGGNNGFIIGIDDSDSDTVKFYFGNATDYISFDGTNVAISGTLEAGSIHIPDQDSTANSFHVESDGDTWWGVTQTDWTADNDNAPAYVKADGTAKFDNATITGSVTATSGAIGGWTINANSITDTAGTVGLSSAVTVGDDIRFWAGNATPASAPFYVTEAGVLTASSGTVGGWTMNATDLYSNNVRFESDTERILIGSATAPLTGVGIFMGLDGSDYEFRVGDPAGNYIHWDGSTQTIKGPIITNIQGGSEISIQGWQHDMAFSATDHDTVAWASGTITLLDGTTYSITGANTGTMSAITYIYLDIATSTTALQTSTTASDAVGSGKILVAVAQNVASGNNAIFQVFNGKALGGLGKLIVASDITANTITANEIAANTITASEIAANTITASQIAANTITATEMNVSQLSAISANLGTITAGNMTIDSSGFIKGGQTAYNTGTGFWLGYDTSVYKFSIGDPSGQYLTWNGSTLSISGRTLTQDPIFGDGSDGDVTISGNTTLSSDMYYDDLTINNGVTLTTANYRIFVKGTLTNNGTIENDGNAGSAGSGTSGGAGGAGLAAGTLPATEDGKTGANAVGGGPAAGAAGTAGDSVTVSVGQAGAAGGKGGGNTGGLGGAAGSATPGTTGLHSAYDAITLRDFGSASFERFTASAGSGSGGSGKNDGTGTPGGGGGSGSPGGWLFIAASRFVNNGTISANGGDGGDGADATGGSNDPGGGGGGGSGGVVIVIGTILTQGTITATGGTGGSAGTPNTDGSPAADGGDGVDGTPLILNLN